jgi:hypothetical protein
MAYVVQAVIAPLSALEPLRALEHGVVVELAPGLGLVPMIPALVDEVTHGGAGDERFTSCCAFPAGFESALAEWSRVEPMAYVEAEYWAGEGSQFAAVWRHGDIVLGPLLQAEEEPTPAEGSPISQALRCLGVSARGYQDEFDVVGMGRHRDVEGWLGDQGGQPPRRR